MVFDFDRHLQDGEQQTIRRGTKPAGGWKNRAVINLTEGQEALIAAMPPRRPHGHGGPTDPTPPPPDPPPNPEPDTGTVQGYARVWFVANGKCGGSLDVDHIHTPAADAVVMPCSNWAQFRTALLDPRKRFIKIIGASVLDGAGTDFKVDNDAYTVDGSDYTGGGAKDYKMLVRCGDNIWTQMKLAPGEGSTASKSADRRAISFNPGNDGDVLRGVCLDHMSLAWGPDVVDSFINNSEDCTMQYCLRGPALYKTNLHPSGTGYGSNLTTPGNSDPSTIYTKRITDYRCLSAFNRQRNFKAEHTDGYDCVNSVAYGWGNQAPFHGNSRGANLVGCILKKSPDTQGSNEVYEEDDGNQHPYAQYANSTYHDDVLLWDEDGNPLTPDWSRISGAALRGTPYASGPTHASHGSLTVDAADATLFADVVANAGRTHEDAVDASIKAHVIAGTSLGGDGFYNGAGYPAPHPSWA